MIIHISLVADRVPIQLIRLSPGRTVNSDGKHGHIGELNLLFLSMGEVFLCYIVIFFIEETINNFFFPLMLEVRTYAVPYILS
jgi:hypothetical protein